VARSALMRGQHVSRITRRSKRDPDRTTLSTSRDRSGSAALTEQPVPPRLLVRRVVSPHHPRRGALASASTCVRTKRAVAPGQGGLALRCCVRTKRAVAPGQGGLALHVVAALPLPGSPCGSIRPPSGPHVAGRPPRRFPAPRSYHGTDQKRGNERGRRCRGGAWERTRHARRSRRRPSRAASPPAWAIRRRWRYRQRGLVAFHEVEDALASAVGSWRSGASRSSFACGSLRAALALRSA